MFSRITTAATICAALGAAMALAAPGAARAADECLAAPKGATPAGAHWYYRLEKGTRRKCWYLADEASRTAKTASSATTAASSSSETSNPPAAKAKTSRRAVADARAELTAPEDDQPALAATTWPPLEPSAETDLAPADPPPVTPEATPAPKSWTMAARWPDPTASAPGNSAPDDRTANAPPADVAPQEALTEPLRIALIALTVVLLAAAVAGRLLLRRTRRPRSRATSRTIWPDARSDDPMPPAALPPTARARRVRPASLDTEQTRPDVAEIEALLRASRGATDQRDRAVATTATRRLSKRASALHGRA